MQLSTPKVTLCQPRWCAVMPLPGVLVLRCALSGCCCCSAFGGQQVLHGGKGDRLMRQADAACRLSHQLAAVPGQQSSRPRAGVQASTAQATLVWLLLYRLSFSLPKHACQRTCQSRPGCRRGVCTPAVWLNGAMCIFAANIHLLVTCFRLWLSHLQASVPVRGEAAAGLWPAGLPLLPRRGW